MTGLLSVVAFSCYNVNQNFIHSAIRLFGAPSKLGYKHINNLAIVIL